MQCEDIRAHGAEYLDGTLPPAVADEVAAHVRDCPDCAEEMEQLRSTWDMLGMLPAARPDSALLRSRVDAAIAGYQQAAEDLHGSRVRGRVLRLIPPQDRQRITVQAVAAAALLAIGVLLGRSALAPSVPDPQITALRDELHDMRQLVTLSLMQQPSASERLKGVAWTSQIEEPGREVVAALLETLMDDANVNVRLATIDALGRFADRDLVRRGAVDALSRQTSPLVQMALIDFVVAARERDSVAALRRLSQDPGVDEAVRARAERGLQRLAKTL